MYKRFKWNERIEWDEQCLLDLRKIKEPSRIFIGSTMELFGEWVKSDWLEGTLGWCKIWPQHTFIFLTKCPQNLMAWSPFPQNVWAGASVTDSKSYERALRGLSYVDAPVRFLSVEPFLGYFRPLGRDFDIFHWFILGCQTPMSEKTLPKREWVDEIISTADKAGIPVFVKSPMASHFGINRKEFPVSTGLRG